MINANNSLYTAERSWQGRGPWTQVRAKKRLQLHWAFFSSTPDLILSRHECQSNLAPLPRLPTPLTLNRSPGGKKEERSDGGLEEQQPLHAAIKSAIKSMGTFLCLWFDPREEWGVGVGVRNQTASLTLTDVL